MRAPTPESHPSTLGLDASEAGLIQIFDTSSFRSEILFEDLVGQLSPESEARQRKGTAIYDVWPRVGAVALDTIVQQTGAVLDVTKLDTQVKQEAFPGVSVPEMQSRATAA